MSFSKRVLIHEVDSQPIQAVRINYDAIKVRGVTLNFKYSPIIIAEFTMSASYSKPIVFTLGRSM